MRKLAAALLLAALPAAVAAQQTRPVTDAVPPDKAALARLNLASEWAAYVPVEGRKDGLARVQLLGPQLFVQTRSGLLVAIDANTGREQWKFKFATAYSAGFPVAVTHRFVLAVNVAELYCLDRLTGAVQFDFELPEAPAAGPAADKENVYVPFTGSKVGCYRLPPALRPEPRGAAAKAAPGTAAVVVPEREKNNPAYVVAGRYANTNIPQAAPEPQFDPIIVPKGYLSGDSGLESGQRTPSLSTLPSVAPPYTLAGAGFTRTPSLSVLPSVHAPFELKPSYLTYNQQTPSIGSLPPSVARLHELSNLRPLPVRPERIWTLGTDTRAAFPPVLVGAGRKVVSKVTEEGGGKALTPVSEEEVAADRVWVFESGRHAQAVDPLSSKAQAEGELDAPPAAPLSRFAVYEPTSLVAVLPLTDGQVVMLNVKGGQPRTGTQPGSLRVEWRANVGGVLNREPVCAADGVYVGGDNSGVARIDPFTGEVNWRTESTADTLLAVNDESVFVRDRAGFLRVYAKGRVNDAVTRQAKPLATLDVGGFGLPLTNGLTDRVLLAADSGLIVCLRDAAAKYARAKIIVPTGRQFVVPPPAKPTDPMPPTDPPKDPPVKPVDPPVKPDPPKDPPKKDGPKTDPPVKPTDPPKKDAPKTDPPK